MTDALAINLEAPCWIRTGFLSKGYGRVNTGGKHIPAHRYMWTVMRGPIPKGMHLHHLCPNKACCNPQHLMVVDPRIHPFLGDTIFADQIARTHCPQGHPYEGANLRISRKGERVCRKCNVIRHAQWQRENTEHVRAYHRKYAQEHRELIREYGRQGYIRRMLPDA